jgi:hypothetical protein
MLWEIVKEGAPLGRRRLNVKIILIWIMFMKQGLGMDCFGSR